MQHLVVLNLFLLLVAGVTAFGGMPGGWKKVDCSSEPVKVAADFAVQTKYPDLDSPKFNLVDCKQQVVAGMKYEIVADLFLPRPEDCSEDGDTRIVRERYLVFDHFGDKTLSQSDAISDSCLP